jgi:hypothetical protein
MIQTYDFMVSTEIASSLIEEWRLLGCYGVWLS